MLVPTFNRAEYLAECLDSLLAQTLPPVQLIVVNDGSTDRTPETIGPYRDRILYLETAQVGKPSAINSGLDAVTGDYLWIFDDDDVALPDALERFVAPLEADDRPGFSYSTFFFTATSPGSHRIGAVLSELEIPDLAARGPLVPLLENNFLGGAALFARMSCYRRVGRFDPALLRSQDYDMAIRIVRVFSGARVAGGATFHYRQHEGARGNTRDRFSSGMRLLKWLEYDQRIFQKLYCELPLGDYLPPGTALAARQREALLERLSIMTGKLLVQEAIDDLRELARLPAGGPFSAEERAIVRAMAGSPYYRGGSLLDRREFVAVLRSLAGSSAAVRALKRELVRAVLRESVKGEGARRILESLRRLFYLHL